MGRYRIWGQPACVFALVTAVSIVFHAHLAPDGPAIYTAWVLWCAGSAGSLFIRPQTVQSVAGLGRFLAVAFLFWGVAGVSTLRLHTRSIPSVKGAPTFVSQVYCIKGLIKEDGRVTRYSIRTRITVKSFCQPAGPPILSDDVLLIQQPGEAKADSLRAGTFIQVSGRFEALPRHRNPESFDYGAFLQHSGIISLFVQEPNTPIHYVPPQGLMALRNHTRQYLEASITRFVHRTDTRHLLMALMLGDRDQLEPSMREWFSASGLTHVLAISGLHVMLLGMVFYYLTATMLLRLSPPWFHTEKIACVSTIFLLIAYTYLAGAPPSAVRASWMGSFVLISRMIQIPAVSFHVLSLAALFQLFVNPGSLFQPGFQLSFSAVAVLLYGAGGKKLVIQQPWKFMYQSIRTSWYATLGIFPVMLLHFGSVPLAGLLLNMLAIPLTAALMSGGLLCVLLGAFHPGLGITMGNAASFLGFILERTAYWGAHQLGWLAFSLPAPDLATTGLLLIVWLWVLWFKHPQYQKKAVIFLVALLGFSVWENAFRRIHPQLEVLFMDVGQGDATLIRFPEGRHVLIDAGNASPYSDAAQRHILPYLAAKGIKKIDTLILTHPHRDHYGGAETLLRHLQVARLVLPPLDSEDAPYRALLDAASERGIPILRVTAGDTLDIDDHTRTRVLWPAASVPDNNPNNHSIVLHIRLGLSGLLFLGDAEAYAERQLARRYGALLESGLVKVAHHGSATSSRPALLDHLSNGGKGWAIVSVAEKNRYGLPEAETLKRWQSIGFTVRQTSMEGGISFRIDGQGID